MIARKTVPLFTACAEIGATLGRADAVAQRALARYGFNFGMAVQLLEDSAIAHARDQAMQHAAEARRAIATLPSSAERDMLRAFDRIATTAHSAAECRESFGTSRV